MEKISRFFLTTCVFLLLLGQISFANELDCSSAQYKYEDNWFGKDKVMELYSFDVDWRDFCASASTSDVALLMEYPVVTCEVTTTYDFSVSTIRFSDGSSGLQLFWKKDGGNWAEYLTTLGKTPGSMVSVEAKKSVPFDVKEVFQHFKSVHTGETDWTWMAQHKSYHTLNFETKRQKFHSETLSKSGQHEYKSSGDSNVYDCSTQP